MFKIKKFVTNRYYRFDILSELGFFNKMDDEKYLIRKYNYLFNDKLDFDNLCTFNQKLQWLKIHDRDKRYVTMVDKYEVKNLVAKMIGEEYIIPTFGVWDSFDKIDFDNLPDKFVLKCTHDSGGNIIVHDKKKLDKKFAEDKLSHCLKRNYFYTTREWPYKEVKPRIIAEKFMTNEDSNDLKDYKFFCFNGQVKFFKIDLNRFKNHRANYYDCSGNILPFGEVICPPDFEADINMPYNLELMINLAEKMSKNITFIRIDFYEVNRKVYFGEFTFYPASGFGKFLPEEWDNKIGKLLEL